MALRLLDHLAELVALGEDPHVVLTGGSLTRRLHTRLADLSAEREDVDWSRVSLWWGDERYVPAEDDERNAGQALQDGLRRLPLNRDRVHPMAASDEGHDSPGGRGCGVRRGPADLARPRARRARLVPRAACWGSDPDGHCASLFPGRPEVHEAGCRAGGARLPQAAAAVGRPRPADPAACRPGVVRRRRGREGRRRGAVGGRWGRCPRPRPRDRGGCAARGGSSTRPPPGSSTARPRPDVAHKQTSRRPELRSTAAW